MKKRIWIGLLVLSLILPFLMPSASITAQAANTKTKTREINIVYDDSGSMTAKYPGPVSAETKWSQAKYAMKVFTAMMGENDTLNIYPMIVFQSGGDKNETIRNISGTMSLSKRIDIINNINTTKTGGTPFAAVEAAASDIKASQASERWLIILTDGAFDDGHSSLEVSEVQNSLRSYAEDTELHIAYVGIGNDAIDMSSLSSSNFISYDQIDENKILSSVTEIASLVYNLKSVKLTGSGNYSFTADVPISKFIVFAQGDDVKVGDLAMGGNKLNADKDEVSVNVLKGKEKTPINSVWPDIQFAPGLNGVITTYSAKDLPFGEADGTADYSFSCNSSNVEVYYEVGVDIQVVLIDDSGKAYVLNGEELREIDAGEYTVKLQMINPLNGEEIKSGSSDLLGDVKLSVNIENGGSTTVGDGDKITLVEGNCDITARADFEDDTSKVTTGAVTIVPPGLKVHFSSETYTIDPVTLECSEPITFTITKGSSGMVDIPVGQIQLPTINGIRFDITDDGGTYTLTPQYAGSGLADVVCGGGDYEITCSDGNMTGGGSTTIVTEVKETELKLVLTVETPEVRYPENDPENPPAYMFDPKTRGVDPKASYLTVKVQVEDASGARRDLSDSEWKAGQEAFRFKVLSNDGNFLFKNIIRIICGQSLNFTAELGSEPSTYKLYLDGILPTQVLPNTSELQITQTIKFSNGIIEEGSTDTTVSVQPLNILEYLGTALIVLGIVVFLLFVLISFIRKKRFDKDMKPTVVVKYSLNGVPQPPIRNNCDYKIKCRYWPWKPQQMTIEMDSDGMVNYMSIDCVAIGGGDFKITNIVDFQRYAATIRIGTKTYAQAVQEPPEMNIGMMIRIPFTRTRQTGDVTLKFTRDEQ